jgi:ribonuclease T2
MRLISIVAFAVAGLLASAPAVAQVKLSGLFVAKQACPAVQSIKKQTNPGDVKLEPGKGYKLIAANNTPATYYWIAVPGADPNLRWVPVSCGSPAFDQPDVPPTSPATDTPPSAPPATAKAEYVLAISWEPAFCEGLPNKTECQHQTATSYEATHFSLHGLWPQPRSKAYCNVAAADQASDKAHNWDALPPVNLVPSVKAALDHVMPGTQSLLGRLAGCLLRPCGALCRHHQQHRCCQAVRRQHRQASRRYSHSRSVRHRVRQGRRRPDPYCLRQRWEPSPD